MCWEHVRRCCLNLLCVAAQEDARLVQLVSGYGAANWSVIAEVR